MKLACANAIAILKEACPSIEGPELLLFRLCPTTPFGPLSAVDIWINGDFGCQVVYFVIDHDGWVTDVYTAHEGSDWDSLERIPFDDVRAQLKAAIDAVKRLRGDRS